MSKNGPSTIRFGFSAADAIKSKVPIVRTRSNGQINLANYLIQRPDLRSVIEARQSEGWRDSRIVEWLKDSGHLGTFRLKAWFDKEKARPARTEYAFSADELRTRADEAFSKRVYRRARLAEFSPKSGKWKKRDRWPTKTRKEHD